VFQEESGDQEAGEQMNSIPSAFTDLEEWMVD